MTHDHPTDASRGDPAPGHIVADGSGPDDWRDIFYLNAFLALSLSDRPIERRERVWIKRFLANRGKPHLYRRMEEIIRVGHCDAGELDALVARAAAELSMGAKRRFIFNLAQLSKSKGPLRTADYERILDLAEKLGVTDTDADGMINAVYSVNNSFIAILGLLALGAAIYWTRSVIVPLVVAIFITMIVDRIDGRIVWILHLKRSRWFTKLASTVAILGVALGLVIATVFSAKDMVQRFPEYQSRFGQALDASKTAQGALSWLAEKGVAMNAQALPLGEWVRDVLALAVSLLSNFVLVAIFTGFLVVSSSAFTGVVAEMNKKVGSYVSIKSLICVLTGVAVFVLCLAFGIDFALFWALLAFLLSYIPVVGAVMASVPPALLAIATLGSWLRIVPFILCLVLVNVVLGQVLEPKLMGSRLALKPVAILLGLVFWGLLWGIPGMFLATPLMVLLRILASYYNVSRGFERLLATDTT